VLASSAVLRMRLTRCSRCRLVGVCGWWAECRTL